MPRFCPSYPGLGLGLFLLLAGSETLWAQTRYAVAGNEKPVALLHRKKETYLVTDQSVFRLERKQFVRKYHSSAPLQSAVATDTALWLGSARGAIYLNTKGFKAYRMPLPSAEPDANITAIFQDAMGAVWLGAAGEGVFRYVQGTLHKELSIPSINTGLATADSSVWIGTNIGLNRWHHQQWTRYNEEGVANHEIPDNIVEKLLLDNTGNLWVLMSEGISVFAGGTQQAEATEHLPTVKFIGKPGNEVYSVAYLAGMGHVFATAMGMLLLPAQPTDHFESLEPTTTDQITPKQLLVPLPTSVGAADPATLHGPCLLQVDGQQRVWLASTGEVCVWTTNAFRHLLPTKATAKLSARK